MSKTEDHNNDNDDKQNIYGKSAEDDWKILLSEWSAALLDSKHLHFEPSPQAIKNQWLGYPGASEEQIRQAEERLGTKLPPSYRSFLKVTNGWRQTTPFIYKLWSAGEVDWFRVRNEDWIEAWAPDGSEVPDEEYFVYGETQNDVALRREYLATALEISEVGDSGNQLYYLIISMLLSTIQKGYWKRR